MSAGERIEGLGPGPQTTVSVDWDGTGRGALRILDRLQRGDHITAWHMGEPVSREALAQAARLCCPACGSDHPARVREAYVEGTPTGEPCTDPWHGNYVMPGRRPSLTEVSAAFAELLERAEGSQARLRQGLQDTPLRAAKAWDELTCGYREPPPKLTTFEAEHDEVVAVAPIPFYSLCEHHLLPFHGTAHIAYLPARRILGLSKFARVTHHYARRLQVQERLTTEIADHLQDALHPAGVAVVVKAEHLCMAMRGAQVPGAITTTSVMRGAFRDKPEARAEALALLGVRA